jgi:hypothetical protein
MRWNWKIVVKNGENTLATTLADGTIHLRACSEGTLFDWIEEVQTLNFNLVHDALSSIEGEMPHPIVDDREILTDPVRMDR